MKVLTVFASTFIPLTFLAGIYGMNFEYIPELGFKYSYLIFWIVVIGVVIGLLLYFKRKKWL
jgi:magnesium transporter